MNGGLTLGSMALFRNIERDSAIAKDYPSLTHAVSILANPQVRNIATVGGNLCNGRLLPIVHAFDGHGSNFDD